MPSAQEVQLEPPFTANVFRSVTGIAREAWDRAFPQPPHSYQFFRTLEETLTHQFTFYYIALYKESRLACLAPCFRMDYPLDTTAEGALKRVLSWVTSVFPRALTVRVLTCGSPCGEGRLGLCEQPTERLAMALVQAMRTIARQARLPLVAFKDFAPRYRPLFEPLLAHGFHQMESYPGASLDIRFPSFDAYLASLSRTTRKDLKRKFKKLDTQPRLTMEVTHRLEGCLDEAHQLYLNTLTESEVAFEIVTKDFFRQLSVHLPEETTYFLWRAEGKLVAFNQCFVSNGVLFDEYLGMDYEVAHRYALYFVTFRDILTWCIAQGIRRYETGAMNYDPKKRLDFSFLPRTNYLKHTNRLMNGVCGLLSRILEPTPAG